MFFNPVTMLGIDKLTEEVIECADPITKVLINKAKAGEYLNIAQFVHISEFIKEIRMKEGIKMEKEIKNIEETVYDEFVKFTKTMEKKYPHEHILDALSNVYANIIGGELDEDGDCCPECIDRLNFIYNKIQSIESMLSSQTSHVITNVEGITEKLAPISVIDEDGVKKIVKKRMKKEILENPEVRTYIGEIVKEEILKLEKEHHDEFISAVERIQEVVGNIPTSGERSELDNFVESLKNISETFGVSIITAKQK